MTEIHLVLLITSLLNSFFLCLQPDKGMYLSPTYNMCPLRISQIELKVYGLEHMPLVNH